VKDVAEKVDVCAVDRLRIEEVVRLVRNVRLCHIGGTLFCSLDDTR